MKINMHNINVITQWKQSILHLLSCDNFQVIFSSMHMIVRSFMFCSTKRWDFILITDCSCTIFFGLKLFSPKIHSKLIVKGQVVLFQSVLLCKYFQKQFFSPGKLGIHLILSYFMVYFISTEIQYLGILISAQEQNGWTKADIHYCQRN